MKSAGISVIIPTYNRLETLRRLLESIARQTHPPSEVIVVDDHSPVGKKIRSLLGEFKGRLPKTRYLRNPSNRGTCHSRNRGILAAQNPLIALCDDDDEWMPQKLEKQADFFKRHWDETEMVFTWVLVKNEEGLVTWRFKPSMAGNQLRKFLSDISGSLPNPSATLIKRESLLQTGLFDEDLSGPDDWDMWLRMLQQGARCRPVKSFLTVQHQLETRLSSSFTGKIGFFHFAAKHFWLFLRVNPVIFLHLAWFMTGVKLGLRKKWGKFLEFKSES